MVKIRLQRRGRRKKPFYHIVIADARSPRDGRFIEKVGTYNPMTTPATIDIDRDAAYDWLEKGAQPTDTVRAILRAKGVMYRRHLQRGVTKGALTQEQADAKLATWIEKKEAGFTERFAETDRKAEAERRKVAGKAPVIPQAEQFYVAPADAPGLMPRTEAAPAAETEAPAAVAAATTVETPTVETPTAEASATEAPTAEATVPAAPAASPAAEALQDAASPEAENADGAVNKAEPALQSAVDTAQNNAAPAPQPAEVDVQTEAASTEDMVVVAEATTTTDQGVASTEAQVEQDGKTEVPA